MGEGLLLGPSSAGAEALQDRDELRRVGALETRPRVQAPVSLSPVPYIPGPQTDWYSNITNGAAFGAGNDSPWAAQMPRVAHRGVFASIPWITEAGTTGEIKLTAASGTKQAATVALPAASSGTVVYRWLHGLDLWLASYNLDVYARRASGANLVRVGYPHIYMIEARGCTATGL